MNNNMPNNMGNGGPVNPLANAANEQLAGGQSTVGNGPSLMQGAPGAQNVPGVMQGAPDVQNVPGVMQGAVNPNPVPDSPAVMPGQGVSGINANTMQVEEKTEDPGVVAVPNFGNATAPEAAVNAVPVPDPVQSAPVVPEPMPNPNTVLDNSIGGAPIQGPEMNAPLGMGVPNGPMPAPGNPMSNPANVIGVDSGLNPNGPEINNGPIDSMNQIGNPGQPNPMPVPPVNNTNVGMNNQIGDVATTNTIGDPAAQPAAGEMNNDMTEMSDLPEKKFPLSTREIILVAVALVGVIAVVIMYSK